MKFVYRGMKYPIVVESNDGYERQIVMIPESSGDYFLSEIDSMGRHELMETVAFEDVLIVKDGEGE